MTGNLPAEFRLNVYRVDLTLILPETGLSDVAHPDRGPPLPVVKKKESIVLTMVVTWCSMKS